MPNDGTLRQLERIEQSISLAPADDSAVMVVTSGPFRAFLSRHTDDPELNYAMPIGAGAKHASLAPRLDALRHVFAAHARRLRLEFMEELWPELAAAATAAGMQLVNREPLMVCTPHTFCPMAVASVHVRFLTATDDDPLLRRYIAIRDEQRDDAIEQTDVGRLRSALAHKRGWWALASYDGSAAGTGRCLPSSNDLGELTAIVTHADLRRRGVASTTTSALVQAFFDAGGALAWLDAANDTAASVYARLGFGTIGHLLSYEDPSG